MPNEGPARFAADLVALWPEDERSGPLGLAVSGGPDSIALLLLTRLLAISLELSDSVAGRQVAPFFLPRPLGHGLHM